jgi:hypothetical protein
MASTVLSSRPLLEPASESSSVLPTARFRRPTAVDPNAEPNSLPAQCRTTVRRPTARDHSPFFFVAWLEISLVLSTSHEVEVGLVMVGKDGEGGGRRGEEGYFFYILL